MILEILISPCDKLHNKKTVWSWWVKLILRPECLRLLVLIHILHNCADDWQQNIIIVKRERQRNICYLLKTYSSYVNNSACCWEQLPLACQSVVFHPQTQQLWKPPPTELKPEHRKKVFPNNSSYCSSPCFSWCYNLPIMLCNTSIQTSCSTVSSFNCYYIWVRKVYHKRGDDDFGAADHDDKKNEGLLLFL